jgi:hypothetical protein
MDTFWCTSRASSRHGHINLFSWWIGLDLVQDALCIWVFLFTYMLFNIYLFYLMCHLWLAYLWYLQHFHHVALFLKSWQSQFYEPNKCTCKYWVHAWFSYNVLWVVSFKVPFSVVSWSNGNNDLSSNFSVILSFGFDLPCYKKYQVTLLK